MPIPDVKYVFSDDDDELDCPECGFHFEFQWRVLTEKFEEIGGDYVDFDAINYCPHCGTHFVSEEPT